jgi:hypothetical protein
VLAAVTVSFHAVVISECSLLPSWSRVLSWSWNAGTLLAGAGERRLGHVAIATDHVTHC